MVNDKEEEYVVPVCATVEEGIKNNVTATGRQLGAVPAQIHGLWRIQYIDGRSGSLPDRLTGKYTGVKFAQADITSFVKQTWQIAAEHTAKPRTKKEKQAEQVAA